MSDDPELVHPEAVTRALAPLLDRIGRCEQATSNIAGIELFSTYPLVDQIQVIEHVARLLAEQPARAGEPRMIRDFREQIQETNR